MLPLTSITSISFLKILLFYMPHSKKNECRNIKFQYRLNLSLRSQFLAIIFSMSVLWFYFSSELSMKCKGVRLTTHHLHQFIVITNHVCISQKRKKKRTTTTIYTFKLHTCSGTLFTHVDLSRKCINMGITIGALPSFASLLLSIYHLFIHRTNLCSLSICMVSILYTTHCR